MRVKMAMLRCPNSDCGYEWDYQGNARFYTSCPRCGWRVHVERDRK